MEVQGLQPHITSGSDNQQYSATTERQKSARNPGAVLKGQQKKISFTATHPGLRQKESGWKQPEVVCGQTVLCGSEERAEGTASRVPVLSPSPTPPIDTIFSGSSTLLHTASVWGNALVPPS